MFEQFAQPVKILHLKSKIIVDMNFYIAFNTFINEQQLHQIFHSNQDSFDFVSFFIMNKVRI